MFCLAVHDGLTGSTHNVGDVARHDGQTIESTLKRVRLWRKRGGLAWRVKHGYGVPVN